MKPRPLIAWMAMNTELMKVPDVTKDEIIKTGRKIALNSIEIALNPIKTNCFFSLPEEFRRTHIITLLLPDN